MHLFSTLCIFSFSTDVKRFYSVLLDIFLFSQHQYTKTNEFKFRNSYFKMSMQIARRDLIVTRWLFSGEVAPPPGAGVQSLATNVSSNLLEELPNCRLHSKLHFNNIEIFELTQSSTNADVQLMSYLLWTHVLFYIIIFVQLIKLSILLCLISAESTNLYVCCNIEVIRILHKVQVLKIRMKKRHGSFYLLFIMISMLELISRSSYI